LTESVDAWIERRNKIGHEVRMRYKEVTGVGEGRLMWVGRSGHKRRP
jgi:hypothetical protein